MNRSKAILLLSIALLALSIAKLALNWRAGTSMTDLVIPFIMVAIILEQAAPKAEAASKAVIDVLRICSFAIGVVLFVLGGWFSL